MKCKSCGTESTGDPTICPNCGATAGAIVAVPGELARTVTNASVEVGTAVVHGTESIGRDVGTGAIEVGRAVTSATETVARDVAQAGKQIGERTEEGMTRVGDHLKPHPAPVAAGP